MWKIDTNTNNKHYHIYMYIQNMFPKVGLLQETKGGGKEEENDIEIYHICVGTRHKETHSQLLNNTG
jgi:hypothetical protein